MSGQINMSSMNMLIEQTSHDTPEARKIARNVPDDIMMTVEEERRRRFEIIMQIPPLQFIMMCKQKLLPWMQ